MVTKNKFIVFIIFVFNYYINTADKQGLYHSSNNDVKSRHSRCVVGMSAGSRVTRQQWVRVLSRGAQRGLLGLLLPSRFLADVSIEPRSIRETLESQVAQMCTIDLFHCGSQQWRLLYSFIYLFINLFGWETDWGGSTLALLVRTLLLLQHHSPLTRTHREREREIYSDHILHCCLVPHPYLWS